MSQSAPVLLCRRWPVFTWRAPSGWVTHTPRTHTRTCTFTRTHTQMVRLQQELTQRIRRAISEAKLTSSVSLKVLVVAHGCEAASDSTHVDRRRVGRSEGMGPAASMSRVEP